MNKLEILKSALESRNDEIENYQINIDNYTLAIEKINAEHGDNQPIVEFRDNLSSLLESHKIEQLKSIIIRDVIAEQITEMEDS
jgi:predicted DNA-binding protein